MSIVDTVTAPLDHPALQRRRYGRAARAAAIIAGVWLMFAPAVLDYGNPAAANDRIFGPIIGSLAFVALWDILVAMRWATVPFGIWLVVSPIVLQYDVPAAWVSSILAGLVTILAAPFGRDPRDELDGGWRTVRPSAWSSPD